jgi:hypothetical protein
MCFIFLQYYYITKSSKYLINFPLGEIIFNLLLYISSKSNVLNELSVHIYLDLSIQC